MPTISKKMGEDILFMRYKQLNNVFSIAATLGISEDEVREFLDRDTEARIKVFKDTPKTSDKYNLRKTDIINFLRNEQQKSCEEIAEMTGLSVNNVYESMRSKPLNKPGHRVVLSREEKRKRNDEILRLNVEEGLTLEAIGKQFGLTRQRVSDILRSMGHVPLTGNTIRAMDKEKNRSILSKKSIDTYNNKLKDLGRELRIVKQKHSMYKYYTTRQLIELRCELMQCILDNWEHNKPISQYKGLAKTLRVNLKHFSKANNEQTLEYQLLRDIVGKCDELDKKNNL